MWCGWLKVYKFLLLGLRVRIGDGKGTKISETTWIPFNPRFKLLGGSCKDPNLIWVSQLMDIDNRRWKRNLILRNFHILDAEAILRIPLNMLEENGDLEKAEEDVEFALESRSKTQALFVVLFEQFEKHLFFNCNKARTAWKLAHISWHNEGEKEESFRNWLIKLGDLRRGEAVEERMQLSGVSSALNEIDCLNWGKFFSVVSQSRILLCGFGLSLFLLSGADPSFAVSLVLLQELILFPLVLSWLLSFALVMLGAFLVFPAVIVPCTFV
ncbi:hypothetical protein STAS_01885 [Striga asiatica]|uniref:Uncharacterized protein n=1 Tax=Striga asiatica TaxID=4170 RepID=A0A5A7P0Z5_STRAF|nr:hypothetical protein STAS_01885 [Striga asiatica]